MHHDQPLSSRLFCSFLCVLVMLAGTRADGLEIVGNLYVASSDEVLMFRGPIVPEPQTFVLFFTGIITLGLLWRRRILR